MNWEWLDFRKDILFWGNSAGTVTLGLLLMLGTLIAGSVVRRILERLSKRFQAQNRRMSVLAVNAMLRVVPICSIALGFVVLAAILDIPPHAHYLYSLVTVLVVVAIGAMLYHLVEVPVYWFSRRTATAGNGMHGMMTPLVRKTLRVTIFIFGAVQVAQILSNQPVTSILAGLGVGGLAVALAAQETIKNFFGSLVLATDRPFEIGDRIVVDSFDGPVEAVGMRSTRIRTLDGHLVTFPNGELANKSIKNITKRPHIKNQFTLGVTYDTSPEKLRRALAILEELLKDHEGLDPEFPPRVTFTGFGEWSLNLQVIYWYHPPDYWAYMAFTQNLNFQILERFAAEEIEFAFPTQTQNVPKNFLLPQQPLAASQKEREENDSAAAAASAKP